MARFDLTCPACSTVHHIDGQVSFRAECDCGQDLHVCITCRFYDKYVENDCREVTADPVATKDRRNLCEYYKPITDQDDDQDAADAAKAKLNALFGDGAAPNSPSSADEAKKRLEDLFKK